MIQFKQLCWPLVTLFLGCIVLGSVRALSYEESIDPRRLGPPLSNVLYLYPDSSSEKLSPARVRLESLLGSPVYGFQKKFDSLSGGTFGVQKKIPII